MRHPIRAALVGGLALLSVGGLAGVAQAQSAANHVVTLALPAGGEVQVAYAGSTPPRLVGFAPAPLSADPFLLTRSAFGAASPFAASMPDAAATTALLRQAELLARAPGWTAPSDGLTVAALPVGPGVCVQSASITYSGDGAAPRVVRRQAAIAAPRRRRPRPNPTARRDPRTRQGRSSRAAPHRSRDRGCRRPPTGHR